MVIKATQIRTKRRRCASFSGQSYIAACPLPISHTRAVLRTFQQVRQLGNVAAKEKAPALGNNRG